MLSRFFSRRQLRLSLALLGFGVVAVAAAAAVGAADALLTRCTLAGRHARPLARTSVLYASDGTYLGAIRAETYRRVVPDSRISPWLKRATVAIEDRRFWTDPGIDPRGLARAAVHDLLAGRFAEGGSTITQQLVRSMYLTDTKTIARKRAEICLSLKLARRWRKQRILDTYLNRAPYGHHAFGVEAAAWTYFGRPAAKLGPAQAALLAGLPQAPSLFDPLRNPRNALKRRNEVLRAMRDTGDLSAARYRRLRARPLGLHPGHVYTVRRAPTFFAYVRAQLVRRYGEQRVRRGGLRVYTTLVPRDQHAAVRSVRSVLDRRGDPAAAVASIDPRTGAVRALASVVHGRRLSFDLAADARRQPGSSFKTFVLADAISRGANPYATRYASEPFTYTDPETGTTWTPHTYENAFFGVESLTKATLLSDNVVFAKLTLDVGPQNVVRMAHRLGIRSKLPPVPSIGLGADAVSPLEMASAYATLAAGGVYRQPHAIEKVVRPGGAVDRIRVPERRAVPRRVAYWVTRVLEQNVRRGTGVAAQLPGRRAAGKTGTTTDWTDGWFVGYTRRLAAAVWVGYPGRTVPMTNVHGIHVAGGTFPAEIWRRYAGAALRGTKPAAWLPPLRPLRWRPWHGALAYHGPSRRYLVVLGTFADPQGARTRARRYGAHVGTLGRYTIAYAGPYRSRAKAKAARARLGHGYVRGA